MSEDNKEIKNDENQTGNDNAEEKKEDNISNAVAEENNQDSISDVDSEEKSDEQETEKTDKKNVSGGKKLFNDITDIFETVAIWLLIFILIRAYLCDQAIVNGTSMVPTLEDTQRVLYSKLYSPDNGDIVIVRNDKLGPLVKRVIAVGGQKVDIRDGYVYVDGEQLDEQIYVDGEKLTAEHFITSLTEIKFNPFRQADEYPLTIPEGYIFIMGDNRCVSNDSRSSDVGFVSEDDVVGKVFMRYLPIKTLKFFK